MKTIALTVIFGIFLVGAVSAIDIYDCQTLDIPGETYVLQNDVSSRYTCFIIGADGITLNLNNYNVVGEENNEDSGVHARGGVSDFLIKNGNIKGFSVGIWLDFNTERGTISGLNISEMGGGGILLTNSRNVYVKENKIFDEYRRSYGIVSYENSDNIIIEKNEIHGVTDGIYINEVVNHNIKENRVYENNEGIFIENSQGNTVSNNIIEDNEENGLHLEISSDNIIINNRISSNEEGILIRMGDNNDNVIRNNKITDNKWAIRASFLHNSLIENNDILSNEEGILLDDSFGNSLINNMIFGNSRAGIFLIDSTDNLIKNNRIRYNALNGLALISSNENRISDNFISNNGLNGFGPSSLMLNINEVELNPEGEDEGNEWVELYSEDIVDLEGYYLQNINGNNYYLSGQFSGYAIISFGSEWLQNSDEKVTLKKNEDIIDETPLLSDNADNPTTWSYCDGRGWLFVGGSPGEQNSCPGNGGGGGGGGGSSRSCVNISGICLEESSENFIYNNLFNNAVNFIFETHEENYWNIPRTRGENIIGGPYLGGNYWANPDGTGYSETCEDANRDGFCDEPYTLEENNVDYLPLTEIQIRGRWKVFVTSFKVFNPNLMETPTANELCQEAADNAEFSGRFFAWLSTSEYNASDIIPEGRYVRVDGEVIADDKEDLLDGHLRNRIRVNELGETMNEGYVYTGTRSTGEKWGGRICNGWQGLDENNADDYYGGIGNLMAIDGKWTEFKSRTCDMAFDEGAHLYCFQVGERALTAEIINPEENETINTNSVLLQAKTNENAFCDYTLCRFQQNKRVCSGLQEMDETGWTEHSHLIDELDHTLFPDYYDVGLQCTTYNDMAQDSVRFFVDLN